MLEVYREPRKIVGISTPLASVEVHTVSVDLRDSLYDSFVTEVGMVRMTDMPENRVMKWLYHTAGRNANNLGDLLQEGRTYARWVNIRGRVGRWGFGTDPNSY